MMRKVLWFCKVLVSGIIAFCILTCFCMFYYNAPVHDETIDRATDYAWEFNKFYSRATEGIAWGRTNNEGYLNTFDYSEKEKIDVLVMGSSHMEAYQVGAEESAAAVLGKLMPDSVVYNIGMSGHNFLVCADNLSAAIAKYRPTEYVVLETSNLFYTDEQLIAAIDETIPELTSHAKGIIGALQKNPYLRLLYLQLEAFKENGEVAGTNKTSAKGSAESYTALLAKMADVVSQNGAELIIVYHPSLTLNEDGSATAMVDEELSAFFAEVCKQNSISFIDMADTFITGYQQEHVLPHGFVNTSVGTGHLNKHGHEMIATAVYQLIKEKE